MKNTLGQEEANQNWDLDISPRRGWFDLHLGDLWRYRDLIKLFVWRDFVAAYKQTILGPIWYVVQPVISTIVFLIMFGKIAKLSTDGTPPFLILPGRNYGLGIFRGLFCGHLEYVCH